MAAVSSWYGVRSITRTSKGVYIYICIRDLRLTPQSRVNWRLDGGWGRSASGK